MDTTREQQIETAQRALFIANATGCLAVFASILAALFMTPWAAPFLAASFVVELFVAFFSAPALSVAVGGLR